MVLEETDRRELRAALEEFLFEEADLLDERRFDNWLDLLADDVSYRVHITRNVHSREANQEYRAGPLDTAWVDEGKDTLKRRVAQFQTGIHWAEEPVSRTSHLITNVRLLSVAGDAEPGSRLVTVGCRFLVYRNRLQVEEEWLVGKRVDRLRNRGDSWELAERTVYLDQTVLLAKNLTTFL